MLISNEIAHWLQHTLLALSRDEWGMVYIAEGILSSIPDYTRARWQFGVDMTYRCIKSDLIVVLAYVDCKDNASLFAAVREMSPFSRKGNEGGLLWNGTQIYGTTRLKNLVKAYFQDGDANTTTVNPSFIEAVEEIFAQSAVPWSDAPLLPIRPERFDDQPAKSH